MNKEKYINKNSFAIIGGDNRSIATAEQLCGLGLDVCIFGFNPDIVCSAGVLRAQSLREAIADADYVLLPLPCSTNTETLNTPLYDSTILIHDLIAHLEENQTVFAGKIDKLFRAGLETRSIAYYDYTEREEFSVLNAIPTAEGAVEIALRELPITLNGSNCLVLGFGRIGKALTHCLSGMGAHVTAAARRHSDLAWIKAYGYEALPMKALHYHTGKFQVIFNTVPHLILDREALLTVAKDCLIIDLASKPGGADVSIR